MAKHAVPKRKQSKTRTKRRYRTFERLARERLLDSARLVPCPHCSAMRQVHHACLKCGKYRGRQVLNMDAQRDKITKIKA